MSLKEIQQNKGADRLDLDELPLKIHAVVKSAVWNKDGQNKNCLYVEYKTEGDKVFTQKYSEMHLTKLAERMEALGIEDISKYDKVIELEKVTFHIGFPRMLPVVKES